jgi:hypothetical protein
MATFDKAALSLKLQGHPPANRDANVTLTNKVTGETVHRKPFLDGTLVVRDLSPGEWELEVTHPNLVQPIDHRVVRVFPQPLPTLVPVPVRPELFRDTPIRDIPDADLSPVQQQLTSVREVARPLAVKAAGEVIRADDWNHLAGAVGDLAASVLELTRLIAPHGHDHTEIAEKIAEVQGNIRRFTESFGRSLVELRRDIESQHLRRTVVDVLDQAGASSAVRDRILGRVADLEVATQAPTATFTGMLAKAGLVLLTEVNDLAVEQGDTADQFLAAAPVQKLVHTAQAYVDSGTQITAEAELGTYLRTTGAAGGSKLTMRQL